MSRSLPLALACLLAAASFAHASEIHVPGDYPNLQAAIDAAAPGDVIVVSTPLTQDPVVIDKALTILGDPVLDVVTKCEWSPGCTGCPSPEHAFRLDGPGAGRVVLGNVTTHSFDCGFPASFIGGGGFDELHVFNAFCSPVAGLTGTGQGASAIKVDVPHILIEGSFIKGGIPDSDWCIGYLPAGIYAAIEAPSSEVTILGSEISGGGDTTYYCCFGCACPPVLPMGGEGGNAIVAAEVFVDAASVVTGGVGSTFLTKTFSGDPGTPCGKKPDGAAFVAGAVHPLPGTIAGSATTPLGGAFTLSFDVPGPLAVLFFSSAVSAAPALLPGAGYVYLVAPVLAGPVPTGAPQSVAFGVPAIPALLGLEGGFQIFDLTLGLTAPAIGVLGP